MDGGFYHALWVGTTPYESTVRIVGEASDVEYLDGGEVLFPMLLPYEWIVPGED